MWCYLQGCGLLPDQYFIMSARRLNASMDLEAEMYRFESNIDAEKQKYSMMDLPTSDHEKQATVAVDAVSTCCLGVPLWTTALETYVDSCTIRYRSLKKLTHNACRASR